MSVNDRINQELEVVLKELELLHHHSVQIGIAREAASNLIKATEEFVSHYRSRIAKVTNSLDLTSSHFREVSDGIAKDLQGARSSFDADLNLALESFKDRINKTTVGFHEVATTVSKDIEKTQLSFNKGIIDAQRNLKQGVDEATIIFRDATQAVASDFDRSKDDFRLAIDQAADEFRRNINEASSSLAEIEKRLVDAEAHVKMISVRLENMDIPGQFRRVQDSLVAIERQQTAQGSDFSARLTGMEAGVKGLQGKLNVVVYLLIGLGVLVAAGIFLK